MDWDLTSIGALENNVTYRVAFTVWPNQDAYDAVLKLNESNGDQQAISQILADYADIADQIVKDPETGEYRIYSNGDATLKYTQYTSTDGGEPVPGEEQTLYYPRPTMETLQYYMKVAKIWNDSIYPENRLKKVKFEIFEDYEDENDTPYQTIILDASSQSETDPNRWEAIIPVSPGIESDQIVDGVRLNEGHLYTVHESLYINGRWQLQDYHYEFDPEDVRPILLNGTMGYEGDANGDLALTGMNHVRGSVTITKKLLDESGIEITENLPEDEFTFQITLLSPGPEGTEIIGKTADDEDAIWYNKYDADGSAIGSADVINSGDIFTLKAGESIRLINVPIGVRYRVEEVSASIPEGYEYVSSAYTYKTGIDGTEQTQTGVDSLYTVEANTWHYVTVTNKVKVPSKDFSFSKLWRDPFGMNTLTWPADQSITVTIMQNSVEYARYTISASDLTEGTEISAVDDGSKEKLTVTAVDAGTGFAFTLYGLPAGDATGDFTYYVAESETVDGFQPPKYLNADGSSANGAVQIGDGGTICNDQLGAELPATGGVGTRLFYLIGSLLVLGALVVLITRRITRK